MLNDILVSVIIPCYNSEGFLEKTVKSILNQSYTSLEIILVDDNSSDNTYKTMERLNFNNSNIKIYKFDENRGAAYARNFGGEKARGNYILFMDADDIASPYLLEKSINRLEEINNEHEKYNLCYTAYIQIDEKDNVIGNTISGIQVFPEETLGYELVRNSIITTSGVLINKDTFLKSGKFNDKLTYSEDWDLWLRVAKISGFAYVDEPLIKVRRHENNLSSKLDNMKKGEKDVLHKYSLDYIEKAISKRKLPDYKNTCDFVSILFRLNYWEKGLEKLTLLIDKTSYYNVNFLLGLYYIKNNNYKLALDNFNKTIKLKKDHGAALNNAGAIYCSFSEVKKGKTYLETALSLYPNYLDAVHNLNLITNKPCILSKEIKFTWRELRESLLKYER